MNQVDLLTNLLNEFYHQSTSNIRKKEIEKDLKCFQENDESWKIILNHLGDCSNNQYLWFFSVSTLELTITRKFNKLDCKSKTQIRDFLWIVYCNFPRNVGALQRDKIAQLIALIGKRQFPDEHPQFVEQILILIKSNFLLGITLLKSSFNEIMSTKLDVTYQKKKNFVQG